MSVYLSMCVWVHKDVCVREYMCVHVSGFQQGPEFILLNETYLFLIYFIYNNLLTGND